MNSAYKTKIAGILIIAFLILLIPISNSYAATAPKLDNLSLSQGQVVWGTEHNLPYYGYAALNNSATSITITPKASNTTLMKITIGNSSAQAMQNNTPSSAIALNEGANIIKLDLYNSGLHNTYTFNIFRNYSSYIPGQFEILNIPQQMAVNINDTLGRGRSAAPLTTTDLASIQTFSIAANAWTDTDKITTLDGLQYATNLKILTIDSCSLIDNVEALKSLTNLNSLTLAGLNLSDNTFNNILDNIANAPLNTLTFRYLAGYRRTFTQEQKNKLSTLTSLQNLNIQQDQITDVSFLAGLTNLKTLDLSTNALVSIAGLNSLTNLTNLNLSLNYLNLSDAGVSTVINSLKTHATVTTSSQNTITVTQDRTDKNSTSNSDNTYLWKSDVTYGLSINLLSCTPKQGYTFVGWDTDNDGIADHQAGQSVTVTPTYDLVKGYAPVYRAIYSYNSSNAYLSSITSDSGQWNTQFNKYQYQYSIKVPNDTDTITLNIQKESNNSGFTISDQNSNTLSSQISLKPGMNFANIHVTSQDCATTNIYSFSINRLVLFSQGDGSVQNPYGISTPAQLNEVREGTSANYILLNDIDMTDATSNGGDYYNNGLGWEPICDTSNFSGSFNGNGYKIIGLNVNRPYDDVGLIGYNYGTIKNLGMVESNICGGDIAGAAGGIAGQNRGTIEYCYNAGNVVGGDHAMEAGGIVGLNTYGGIVKNCYNVGSVHLTYDYGYVGGIAGGSFYGDGGTIQDCFNAGNVSGCEYIGGIAGRGGQNIHNCYNVGNLSGDISHPCGIISDVSGNGMSGLYYLDSPNISNGAKSSYNGTEYANKETDLQMHDQNTFVGFDFNNTWTMGNAPYPYPILKNITKIDLSDNTTDFSGGNGLKSDPYKVSTPEQLNNIRDYNNSYFILTADIDMTAITHQGGEYYNGGLGFDPIGPSDDAFKCNFDAGGHSIKGLYINRPDEDYAGLFGYITQSTISNLNITDADISGKICGGVFVVALDSDISNCTVTGKIGNSTLDTYSIGGIGGSITGGGVTISDCRNLANIITRSNTSAGGIIGCGGVISRCYNAGSITICNSTTAVGGIVGLDEESVSDCFNTGNIKCPATIISGGIIGDSSSADISNCYNTGETGSGILGHGGYSHLDKVIMNNCYYLYCNVSTTDSYGVSKTLPEMKTQSTYQNYDFDNVWSMTQSFPILKQLPYSALTSAVFAAHSIDLVANTTQLDVVFSPLDATNKNCIWESSNENVAKVEDGIVTLVSSGSATVSFITLDGGFTDSCTVTVGTLYYTVSFNTGDGGGSIVPIETVSYDNVVVKPDDPIKQDYIFLGWYTDSKCTTLWDFSRTVKANVTLYAGWTPVQPYKYVVRDGKATITGYEGLGGDVVIPNSIDGYQVNAIDYRAFYECYNITTIALPAGITSIGDSAFEDCIALTSIAIPNGVINIPNCCFYYCKNLKNITLPNNLQSIGMFAFYQTEISNITLPASLNQIGTGAFCETPLQSITIPDGVTTIKSETFQGCYALTSVNIPDSVTEIDFAAFSGCRYLYNVTIPKNVTNIEGCAFSECSFMKTATFEGNAPASFGDQVFNYTYSTFKIHYYYGKTGWTTTTWKGYSTVPICTVTFDSQGGSDVNSLTAIYGGKITQPQNPTLSGHVFLGWYMDSNYKDQWDFVKSTVQGNLKLYAKWIEGTHEDVVTQEGSNVSINDNSSGVSLTFDTVTSGGETTIEAMKSKPSNADFYLNESCGYYNIETTAAFNGAVIITLSYDPSEIIGSESDLRLYQFKDGVPIDITESVDSDNNTITGLVTDHFCAFAVGTPKSYTITASNNASCGTVTGGGTYNHGDPIMLHAIPDKGYHFVHWTEGGSQVSTSADYSFTVTEGRTLTAIFEINSYTITISANNPAYGKVTGGGTYNHGAPVNLSAAPNTGYRFVRWTENSTSVSTNVNYPAFTATGGRSLIAEFTALTPVSISCSKTDVTLYGGSNGTVTINALGGDSGTYEYSINGGTSWQNSNVFARLHAGTYTAAVRDAIFKNLKTNSVIVGQPSNMGRYVANKIPVKVNVGTAISIIPPVAPMRYAITSVTYTSSNASVAAVDASGNVTFLTGGKATITTKVNFQMTDSKGKVKTKTTMVKKTVTVNQLVSSITLNLSDTTLVHTKQVKLTATIAPPTASCKKVTWKSSNFKVATVSSSGVVTGKTAGTVIITCTSKDGSGVSASCTVTVTPI